jgi:hypothetical protein
MKNMAKTNGIKLRMLGVVCVIGILAVNTLMACVNVVESACPQKHGACTLIDDVDRAYTAQTVDKGAPSYTTTVIDACGYQCGTEYEGVGYQLYNNPGSCP